jgi:hypothetical protein
MYSDRVRSCKQEEAKGLLLLIAINCYTTLQSMQGWAAYVSASVSRKRRPKDFFLKGRRPNDHVLLIAINCAEHA